MSSLGRLVAYLKRRMTARKPELDAIAAIGSRRVFLFKEQNERVEIGTLLRLFSLVTSDGSSAAHGALGEVLCRLIEIALIRDPLLERLVQRWSSLSAQAPSIVKNRVKELTGVEPPDETVRHLVNILGGSATQHGRRVAVYEDFLPEIFQRHALQHPRKELRCACCGYHFTAIDLNPQRRLLAEDRELVLADVVAPSRITDTWKPATVQIPAGGGTFRPKPVTGLTIDHVVPEEGLGWAGADNLEILCAFCNTGKMAYRWALEPVSLFGAGGCADYPPGRPLNKLAQTTIVSALMYSGGTCAECGKTTQDVELTVRPVEPVHPEAARGFAPWNLKAVCYGCL